MIERGGHWLLASRAAPARRGRVRAVALGLMICCFSGAAKAEDDRKLSDAEIKHLITGKTVTDDIHYADFFNAGGTYESVFMNKRSTGTWIVKNGLICITRISEPESCDELWQSGGKLQRRKHGLPNVRDDVIVLSK
jgi:hypothetical protein